MRPRRRNTGRLFRRLAAGGVALLLAVGCRSSKKYEGIEAELRTRNRELAETQHALDRARELNRAYEQTRAPIPGGVPAPPYYPAAAPGCSSSIREIALGRGTGGVDDDALPGDEYLMAVIVPTDDDRSAVKVQGKLTIAAWEYGTDGLKRLIGTWELSPEQLRSTWKSGLLATGFFVPLQWQQIPTMPKVRVAARLTTLDGKSFEADRDITVRPPMGAYPAVRQPLMPSAPPVGVPPTIPQGFEELPPPAGLQPR
jgi:hypothetical protein